MFGLLQDRTELKKFEYCVNKTHVLPGIPG